MTPRLRLAARWGELSKRRKWSVLLVGAFAVAGAVYWYGFRLPLRVAPVGDSSVPVQGGRCSNSIHAVLLGGGKWSHALWEGVRYGLRR